MTYPINTTNAEPAAPDTAGPWGRPPGSRPSPRPRPAPGAVTESQTPEVRESGSPVISGPAAPYPVPDDVTPGNSPVSSLQPNGEPSAANSRQENGAESLQSPVDSPADEVTLRKRLCAGLVALRAYITPPQVWAEPPASMAELAAYARWGAWTTSTGPVRRLGIVWHRLVGLPVTTVCRYVEWIAQRPGRAIPVFLLWKLLITTGPGPGFVDHVIRPALAAVAWVLL
jgi:hypothetical protein